MKQTKQTETTSKSSNQSRKASFSFRLKPFRSVKQFIYVYNVKTWWPTPGKKLNKLNLPRFILPCNEIGATVWNKLIDCLKEEYYDQLDRTPSGGLRVMQTTGNGWYIEQSKRGCTLVAYLWLNQFRHVGFRVSFESTAKINELGITGRAAYFKMRDEFKKDNINLDDYAVENGKEIKEEIKKPMIELGTFTQTDNTYVNASHIDLHSAYPSGIVANYPELKPTIERIYNNRKNSKQDTNLKLQLDAAIGYFQSEYCTINHNKYALAKLAKAGVNWCYDTINEIAEELNSQDKTILAFNTDGIWFIDTGKRFKSKWIGDGLGKAAIDHTNCKIRFKSKGSYEFIENGKYTPVVRGSTRLDQIKSRDQWKWGDIYQKEASIIYYRLDEKTHKLQKGE